MKGVGAAHQRFGALPFAIFDPRSTSPSAACR
jgi:hypothetical protein